MDAESSVAADVELSTAQPARATAPVAAARRITEPDLVPFEEQTVPRRSLLRRLVPTAIRRRLCALRAWTHTTRALRLGTAATALLGGATLGALVLIGFVGIGTHNISPAVGPYYADNSGGPLGPQAADLAGNAVFAPPAPFLPPTGPLDTALSQSLSRVVLQPEDLSLDFVTVDSGATGAESATGLIASYHAVYQRPVSTAGYGGDWTVAVISMIAVYRNSQTASFHLLDVNPNRLAVEAGVPTLSAETELARTIGQESRVIHLTGTSAGVNVGVYLVQFRRGATNALVGVAAVLGSESLDEALALADRQDAQIVAAALPPLG